MKESETLTLTKAVAERIRELLQACPANMEILDRIDDMSTLLLDTDFCVTAGGSTCWELCCMGVSFLTVEVAENQRAVTRCLAALGFAGIFSGNSFATALREPFVKATVRKLCELVDGAGCRRILAAIADLPNLFLRPALPEDCMAVFALANDAQVRKNAFSSSRITEEDHVRWYATRLKAEDSPFYAAFSKNMLVGYIRYDKTDIYEERVVTIAIAKKWRGKGIGTWLLRETVRHVCACGVDSVIAWVNPKNIASQKAFQQAGYVFLGQKQHQDRIMCCFKLRVK